MTICNVILGEDGATATVYTDTACATPDGVDLGEASKVWIVPGLKAVVTGRGVLSLMAMISSSMMLPMGASFESAIDGLRNGGMKAAADHLRETLPGAGVLNHVVIVGWSIKARRYRLWLFRQEGGTDFEAEEIEASMFAPWPGQFGPPPTPRFFEDYISIAERQRRFIKHQSDGYAAGGRLHRTELRPDGGSISVSEIHRFSDRVEDSGFASDFDPLFLPPGPSPLAGF